VPKKFQGFPAELSKRGAIFNQDLRDIWRVDCHAALRGAKRLVEAGRLAPEGSGKGRRYKPGPKAQGYATPS